MSSTVIMNQFSRFLVVGVLNSVLGYSVISACMYLAGMSPEMSNVAGYAIGLVASYVLNKPGFARLSVVLHERGLSRFDGYAFTNYGTEQGLLDGL